MKDLPWHEQDIYFEAESSPWVYVKSIGIYHRKTIYCKLYIILHDIYIDIQNDTHPVYI